MAENNEILKAEETEAEIKAVEAAEAETPEIETIETETATAAPAAKKESTGKLIFTLMLKLFVITSAVALLLGGVNAVTKEPIAKYAQEKRAAAMEAVLKDGRVWLDFDTVEITVGSSKSAATVTPMVDGLSSYHSLSGLPHALCVETHPSGYGGAISLMTGIQIDETEEGATLTVSAVRIVSHSETSGVGSKTTDPAFLAQYEGKVAGITINGAGNSINAISGATISSKAVTAGVNEALDAANEYVAKVLSGEIKGVFTALDASETEGGDAE